MEKIAAAGCGVVHLRAVRVRGPHGVDARRALELPRRARHRDRPGGDRRRGTTPPPCPADVRPAAHGGGVAVPQSRYRPLAMNVGRGGRETAARHGGLGAGGILAGTTGRTAGPGPDDRRVAGRERRLPLGDLGARRRVRRLAGRLGRSGRSGSGTRGLADRTSPASAWPAGAPTAGCRCTGTSTRWATRPAAALGACAPTERRSGSCWTGQSRETCRPACTGRCFQIELALEELPPRSRRQCPARLGEPAFGPGSHPPGRDTAR